MDYLEALMATATDKGDHTTVVNAVILDKIDTHSTGNWKSMRNKEIHCILEILLS